jgi:hypothetical protein
MEATERSMRDIRTITPAEHEFNELVDGINAMYKEQPEEKLKVNIVQYGNSITRYQNSREIVVNIKKNNPPELPGEVVSANGKRFRILKKPVYVDSPAPKAAVS